MSSNYKTNAKLLGAGALVSAVVVAVTLLYAKSCGHEQAFVPVATPQPRVTTTSTATASTAVAQTVTVRIKRPKKVIAKSSADTKPEPAEGLSEEEIVVEVTQHATASAMAAATSSVTQEPEETSVASGRQDSDLTDASRWGFGAGLVQGTVFVDYQLIRQRILNQELSLDVQANHVQAGAGLAITVTGPVFVETGLSFPYTSTAQPVPYLGAGLRLRF